MDETDTILLGALSNNGRLTMRELAATVDMSAPSVKERVQRLQDRGIVRKFTIEVDPKSCGFPVTAIILARPLPGKNDKVEATILDIPQCVECDRVTGDACFIARFDLKSVESIDGILQKLLPLAETTTSIVKSSPLPRRPPL